MFMKTFEEKWTAWVDGELSGAELSEFEAALPDKAQAEVEKRDAHKLGVFLKEQLAATPLGNEDFFNHQLRQRIAAEAPTAGARGRETAPRPGWSLGRLVWVGATSLAIFAVCAIFIMREQGPADQSQYLSQILNARVDPAANPNASVSVFQAKDEKATVIWLDGLKTLPPEYASK